jgi:hypothetical protein
MQQPRAAIPLDFALAAASALRQLIVELDI